MVSEYLTSIGRLCLPNSITNVEIQFRQLPRRQATEYLEYGKDNYWDGDKMVRHTLEIGLPIFEAAYPSCQGVWLFDNATNHSAYAEDALVANRMNFKPGGQQPVMREGFIHSKGRPQPMTFPDNYGTLALRGLPKGMKQILTERGLYRPKLRAICKDPKGKKICKPEAIDCCCQRILSLQRDFLEQKGKLQEELESRGHIVLFYPRFHCELNFIEYFWGYVKREVRENCDYKMDGLRENVPQALSNVPISTIWRFYAKCVRTMDAYRDGYIYGTKDFQQHVYKSHRKVKEKDVDR